MKNKLLLFLAFISFIGYSQNPTRFSNGVQITGGQPTVTSTNFLTATDATGVQTKIAPVDSPFTPISKVGKGLISGDSTVASYLGQTAVADLLVLNTDILLGNSITNIAVPGNTIAQQKTAYLALSDKNTYDYVVVQIGLNDVGYTESDATVIARLQDYINTINANKKLSCKVIIGTMLPCLQRFYDLYGNTNGAIAQAQWVAVNESIKGNGSNPITSVNTRVYEHTAALADFVGSLAIIYDMGDHIHENNSGRNVIANSHRKALNALGFLKSTTGQSIEKYSKKGIEIDGTIYSKNNADNISNIVFLNRNDTQRYGFTVDINAVDDGKLGLIDISRNVELMTFLKTTGQARILNLAGAGDRIIVAESDGKLKAITTPPDSRPYKVYAALLSQTGTSAPTAIVLENTLGGTIVWTRTGIGSYVGTLSGAFTANKTAVFFTKTAMGGAQHTSSAYSPTTSTVIIENSSPGGDSDIAGDNSTIEIRVYN